MVKFKQSKNNKNNFSIAYNSNYLKDNENKQEILACIYEILSQANDSQMRVQCIKKNGTTTYYFYDINNCTKIDDWVKDKTNKLNKDMALLYY